MYEDIEHLPQTQHSKAQSALHKEAAHQVRAEQSATAQAGRELARASMSSSIYTARCVLKTNEEIEVCTAKYTTTQKAAEIQKLV